MKNPFNRRMSVIGAKAIDEAIRRALASGGLSTTSGPLRSVTETIKRALSRGKHDSARLPVASDDVIDVTARVVDGGGAQDTGSPRTPPIGQAQVAASFERHEFSNPAGARNYKLYVPAAIEQPPPLLVMLHGCTQSADDFAAGTAMNRLADEHGLLVVYPEQAAGANPSKCWNWFKAQDQVRDSGEPSLIAGIVREVAARHGVDSRRIFVAGLSAGAAMAVILGETYPELFAGVGAHSGLPYGSAHDIPSAMAAMKGGRSGMAGLMNLPGAAAGPGPGAVRAVPTIVFHGDRDHTVQPTNGAEIVEQAKAAHSALASGAAMRVSSGSGTSSGGRNYSRTTHADAGGQPTIESWTLHGAGHAWSGGDESGSYTDSKGPDASAEMLRFFLALPRAGSA